MANRGWIARHELVLFFVLAYVFSWAVWPLMLANPTSTPMVPFGPLIAAVIITALAGGRRSVLALVKQLGRWRVHPLWYLVGVLGPFVLVSFVAVVVVITGAPWPDWRVFADVSGLVTSLVATALVVGLFEEIGWRGFAQPRMQRHHSALWAALVLGIVWALWHVPELVSNPTERDPVPFLLSVTAWSVLITWLYNSTGGSLPIVILFHAAINTAIKFLLPQFEEGYSIVAWWSLAGVSMVAAAAVVVATGPDRLTTRPGTGRKRYRSPNIV